METIQEITNNNNNTFNTSNNWHKIPPRHRHTIDKINISNYRAQNNITNNNKTLQREDSQVFQQQEVNNNNANDENNKKKENEGASIGMLTLQHCMARLADLAKGYGSISLDIPSTEKIISGTKSYTLYVIKIMDPELHQWEKKYRYSELLVLHKHIMKNYANLIDKPFPDKTYTTNKTNAEVIDWRKFLLQKYLRQVINNQIIISDPKVREYLFE